MDIIEEGKWLKLSKIGYKNDWYQIYANRLGIRVFIKSTKEEMYPDLESFMYLDMIFNSENNGIYYDENKTKQLLVNYFKFTLNLNIFYKAYKLGSKYIFIKNINSVISKIISADKSKTLITTDEIKEYLPEIFEIDEIIDNNENISDEYKTLIKKYVLEHSKDDLTILAYNLKQLEIVTTTKRSYFDKFNYQIGINETEKEKIEENLYHELRHASKFTSVDDIYTVLHNDFLIKNYKSNIGLAILEGINSKYTSKTYLNEQEIIDIIILIIGEDELLKCENQNILNLIELLSRYSSKEKIIKLIMMLDENLVCRINKLKYDLNSKMMIYRILMECYFNKIDDMLDNLNPKNIVYKIKKYNEKVKQFSDILVMDNKSIKESFDKEYNDCYNEYVKKHIDSFDFEAFSKMNNHEEIEGFIFIERQIYDQNYIINDENFIVKRIKYNNSNDIYVYDIYIKDDYLKNALKEELLEYVSLDGLNVALEKLGDN